MLPVAWYLLKVIICSGILFSYYWLLLRNKVFHKYNRFYLMASVLLSLLLPLIKINFWQQHTEQQTGVIKVLQVVSNSDEYMDNIIVSAKNNPFDYQQLYPLVYLIVSLIFLFLFLHSLYSIFSLLKKYPKQYIDKISLVNTDAKSTPFSFLNYIFWNNNIDMETSTGNKIFKHELAHVEERHTYDKLFINIVLLFFWCNPFYWLYRKELNMIHEFIADKKAVEDSDTAAFAAMILQAAYPKHSFELANNFFYSPINRRLLMLTKIDNPRISYFARLMVLPLAVLVFAAFTFKAKSIKENFSTVPKTKQVTENIVAPATGSSIIEEQKKSPKIKDTVPDNAPFIDVEKALIIFNGKILGKGKTNIKQQYSQLFTKSLQVTFLKKTEAIAKYGKAGVDGACELSYTEGITITTASVDADKMNVVYIGIENLLTIESDNLRPEDMVAYISQGAMTGYDGKYLVFQQVPGEATITILRNDGYNIIGTFKLRVKRLPDPADPNLPPALRNTLKFDSSNISLLKQKLLLEQQRKAELDYTEKQLQYIVATNNLKKSVVDKKIQEKQLIELKQKLNTQQQTLEKLNYAERLKTNLAVENEMMQEKELLIQKNNLVFTQVDQNPQFTGGQEAWKNFLRENIKANIPVDNGAKAGIYKVVLKFIVNADGSLSNIKCENDPGYGICAEAIRFIKSTPKWQPAVQNGKKVNAYLKQPITFVVEDDNDKSGAEIYKVPLKVHMMNENEVKTYHMISNGEFAVSPGVLYYLNGKVTDNPKSILKMEVIYMESYDPGSGKKYFGEKGKNGVLLLKNKS